MSVLINLMHIQGTNGAKYPLSQKCHIIGEQFLVAFDWFTTYNRGKLLICGRQD